MTAESLSETLSHPAGSGSIRTGHCFLFDHQDPSDDMLRWYLRAQGPRVCVLDGVTIKLWVPTT